MTTKQKIVNKLRSDGYIDNFYCIEQKITTRLSAFINVLRDEKWEIDGRYIPGTKNFRYTLRKKTPKFRWIEVERDGVRYSKQVVISEGEKGYSQVS